MKIARHAGGYLVERDGAWVPLSDAPWAGGRESGGPVAAPRLLAPCLPGKIVCVGRNYAAHARELGNEVPKEPLLFFKPPSSVIGPNGVVALPRESERVEHEAEVAVVIGQRLRRADEAQAAAAIFGYTAACDVTARDLQKRDGQWTRAKGFDTFCPLGPWIVSGAEVPETISCTVNGVPRQNGRTADMVFSVPVLLAYISQAMTLEPGDVVLTGTPEGVGPLADGDRVAISVAGVGVLEFSCASEEP
jgi:2-keto-4-pentenoate hydratase/2-oxohepta-3-ene-1,7-dioic acid hydratase in catechol pathway